MNSPNGRGCGWQHMLYVASTNPVWLALTHLSLDTLQWRHNGRDIVSNHQPSDCLLNGLFKRRSKKTSKPRVTGLCAGNSPETGEFPAQMASDAENVSIWWRHHAEWPPFWQTIVSDAFAWMKIVAFWWDELRQVASRCNNSSTLLFIA